MQKIALTPEQERLVCENQKLVSHMYRKLNLRGIVDYEDAYEVGLNALMVAAQRYDPSREANFTTYACQGIYLALICRRRKEMRRARHEVASLDAMTEAYGDFAETMFMDSALPSAQSCEDALLKKELTSTLNACLDELPDELRSAVRGYYLEGLKQQSLAERDGVSQSLMSKRIRWGLAKLSALLTLRGWKDAETHDNGGLRAVACRSACGS